MTLATAAWGDQFWATADQSGECWLWTGTKSRKGYGVFCVGPRGSSVQVRAHRLAWEITNDRPVPPGLLVRHTCDTPACIRPDHLLLGTIADNNQDRLERGGYQRKTHCPQGHAYDEANTWVTRDGFQKCRTCDRDRQRRKVLA